MNSSYPDVTDLFCGAGGSSWGAEQAGATVRLAMNHWERAIATHSANFPNASHDICDISAVDPRRYRRTSILIASPECTNHSLAKGQKRKYQAQLELFGKVEVDPAAERSRVTMFDVPRFADYHDYDIVIVENVVDARKWRLFDAWLNSMVALDYDYEIVYLNSMFAHLSPLSNPSADDFAPQSRDRMYVVFWKRGIKRPNLEFRPLAFCPKCEVDVEAVQSWKKKGKAIGGVYGERRQYVYCCPTCAQPVKPYYYCAANCIDFSVKGERIGDRKRPLKPKTIERIRLGLQKFGSQTMLIPQAYSHGHDNRAVGVHMPAPTQTTRQDVGVAFPPYLLQYYSRDDAQSGITDALPTVTTEPRHALITPPMVMEMYGKSGMRGVDEALSTVTAGVPHHALVSPPPFLSVQYSPGYNMPVSDAMGTVTTNDHHALVTPPFLTSYYGGSNCYQGVFDDAVGTITAKERHALVHPQIEVEDCHFRMLMPKEIGLAMGFNPNYRVIGTKKEQVRQYGNAVTPVAMKRLTERCLEVL